MLSPNGFQPQVQQVERAHDGDGFQFEWRKFFKNIDQYVIYHFTNMQVQIQLLQVVTKITNLIVNIHIVI